jgi:hypothetical protein
VIILSNACRKYWVYYHRKSVLLASNSYYMVISIVHPVDVDIDLMMMMTMNDDDAE